MVEPPGEAPSRQRRKIDQTTDAEGVMIAVGPESDDWIEFIACAVTFFIIFAIPCGFLIRVVVEEPGRTSPIVAFSLVMAAILVAAFFVLRRMVRRARE